MTRAVVDTNIFIRAVIMPSGTVGPTVTRLCDRDYALVYSAPVIDELLSKLALPRIRQKYRLTDQDVDDLACISGAAGSGGWRRPSRAWPLTPAARPCWSALAPG